ncbi:peroxisome biogenesis factor 10 [Orbilia ellipsospora]|uniref:RING-type E3 ubiquitin transferase n=1 Tax=Orbilia ellipsospora TaxID=2528407 RepID=A0AAV9X838_9PEZI
MTKSTTSGSPVVVTDIPQPENVDGYDFPFAAAPDIIRSNQKDAYFQGVILEQLSTILRNLYGARILHKFNTEAKVFSELLYLGITTLIGSRTLGEEYCDIVHVDADSRRLPNIIQRAGYIISVVILPYITSKFAPKLRARIRMNLDRRAARRALTKTTNNDDSMKERFFRFIHRNLDTFSGMESLIAVHLSFFYFSGAYYHVSKRIWGMRYIFTKRLQPHEQRVGYEVLGVLLLVQIVVQTYSKMSDFLSDGSEEGDQALSKPTVNKNIVTGEEEANVDLENPESLAFVQGEMARKCTLCLESMKDPTLTPCGHMFCWSCISEWCRNKPECPLCRSSSLPQHLLVLRGQ